MLKRKKSEEARKIDDKGCKMKKVGPCNFGVPQLFKFLKKVLVGQKYMFLGYGKKFGSWALLSLQKWKKLHFLAVF